jgi:hypothetical protein
MNIEVIQQRVHAGHYLVKGHAVQHAIKEGFERRNIIEAVLRSTIIEEYPSEQRALVCGKTTIPGGSVVYLHVVCEYVDPVYVEFVTAYIPDEVQWERPPFRRRRRKVK